MLRRFSSTFRKDRKKENSQANGSTQTNGNIKETKAAEHVDHAAERGNVNSTFSQFAQVLHAAQRPLPTQTGDGSYLTKEESSGLLADIKNLGFKDIKTLKEVMENKAKGDLVDDKTYIMERVIQVRITTLAMRFY